MILSQKLTNNEWGVTRCIIVQQRPSCLWITIFGLNTMHSSHQTLQNFEMICASNCLASWNEFPMDNFFAIEECNEHCWNWPSFTITIFYPLSLPSKKRLCHRKKFVKIGTTRNRNATAFKRRSVHIGDATSYSNIIRVSELICYTVYETLLNIKNSIFEPKYVQSKNVIRIISRGLWELLETSMEIFDFFIKVFYKHKNCSYFDHFCRMWLVNELVLTFLAPIKYAKVQLNLIILLGVIEYTT